MPRWNLMTVALASALIVAGCTGSSGNSGSKDSVPADAALADSAADAASLDLLAPADGNGPVPDGLVPDSGADLLTDSGAPDVPVEPDGTAADVAADSIGSDSDVASPEDVFPGDVIDPSGVCPVLGYEACGGDLLGKWKFLDMCPEDPVAANDLCESPFDNLPACVGGGNDILCDSVIDGTLEFIDADTAKMVSEHWIVFSWVFTDACLVAAGQPGADSQARCLSLNSEKLTCTYAADACTCSGQSWKEPDDTELPYSASGSEMTLFQDELKVSYCIDGDQLVIDHYFYHPVSWRYWVLEKATDEPPPASLTLEQATALLPGVWEAVGMEDSGNPFQPVPPGQFNVFTEDGKFSFKCDQASSITWKLIEKWNMPTVEVTLSPGSVVYWVIQTLTETKLSYIEGGDTFHYERRTSCR